MTNLIPLFILLGLGWICGRIAEIRHYRSIQKRESRYAGMVMSDLRTCQPEINPLFGSALVMGEVVIATDYMKSFLAGLRMIIGGELRSYETLVDRARREAILRLQQQAEEMGYNAVCNLRLGTSDIGGMTSQRGATMVEVFAYGTAYSIQPHPSS
jgi:uncharacterized protein YbjQ (UPF0145 family)